MEINEVPLIRQSVFESYINSVDNQKLVNELNSFYANSSTDQNLAGVDFPDAGPETEKLKIEIFNRVNYVSGKEMRCKQFWMLYMNAGGSVPQHNHKNNYQLHPEEYYSIAYYPVAPEGGANIHFVGSYCNTLQSRIMVEAKPGKLVIFNSFLDHYTDRHWGEQPRVCISANFKPVEPNKDVVSDWSAFAQPRYLKKPFLAKE